MIKKIIQSLVFSLFAIAASQAAENSQSKDIFLATENGKIINETGNINERHTPCSSFKIALVLVGFDSGFLQTKDSPRIEYKPEFLEKWEGFNKDHPKFEAWQQPQTPTSFLVHSCIWFSHKIANHLGIAKLTEYLTLLNYGNADISGTPGKDNQLFDSWIQSSLEISPREQVTFLEKLLNKSLPLSPKAQEKVVETMTPEDLGEGWTLHGKTGSGGINGWFVGWIEKDNRRIVFAQYLGLGDNDTRRFIGKNAKEMAITKLLELVKK